MSSELKLEACFSCNRQINPGKEGSVIFPCPSCGARIVRCSSCRQFSNTYKCPGCGFEGP